MFPTPICIKLIVASHQHMVATTAAKSKANRIMATSRLAQLFRSNANSEPIDVDENSLPPLGQDSASAPPLGIDDYKRGRKSTQPQSTGT